MFNNRIWRQKAKRRKNCSVQPGCVAERERGLRAALSRISQRHPCLFRASWLLNIQQGAFSTLVCTCVWFLRFSLIKLECAEGNLVQSSDILGAQLHTNGFHTNWPWGPILLQKKYFNISTIVFLLSFLSKRLKINVPIVVAATFVITSVSLQLDWR